jgi:GT2 family glycosyltransferase
MLDITLVLFRPRLGELQDTFRSLSEVDSEFNAIWILVSGSEADAASVRSGLGSAGLLDRARIEHRLDNLGFASGHNRLARKAFVHGADQVLILNPDVMIRPGSLSTLARVAKLKGDSHLFGPTLGRHDLANSRVEVFDSAGIGWSRSGRHFDKHQGEPWAITAGHSEIVAGVTGACLLVPREAYDKIVRSTGHFFDDAFLAYREDAELGIRAGLVGISSVLVHVDGFSHVRSVRGYTRGSEIADLLGVKNRYLIRWKLGKHRPGSVLVGTIRDIAVIGAVLLREKSSLPGLKRAFAIRRYERYWGAYLAAAARRVREG